MKVGARVALCSAMVLLSSGASAHPEHCAQSGFVQIEADRVEVSIELSPGSAVARALVAVMDTNADGELDREERARYAQRVAAQVSLTLDGVSRAVRCEPGVFASLAALDTGAASLTVRCQADSGALAKGEHTAVVRNDHRPVTSAYTMHVFARAGGPTIGAIRRSAGGDEVRVGFTLAADNDAQQRGRRRRESAAVVVGAFVVVVAGAVWLRRRSRESMRAR